MENDYIILSDNETNAIMRFASFVVNTHERYMMRSRDEHVRYEVKSEIVNFYKEHIAEYRKIHALEKEEREKILRMAIDTGISLEYSLPMIENYYKNGQLPDKTK